MTALAWQFLAVVVILIDSASGHGYMKSPRSRNYVAFEDGVWYGGGDTTPQKDSCPHCLNRQAMANGKLGTCGSMGATGSRNYDEPKNYNGGPLAWNSQSEYVAGSSIDIKVVLTAHHYGHFEVKCCPRDRISQDCFDKHPLEFVSDELYGAPKDSDYPGRAYIAPPGMAEGDNSGVSGKKFHYKFKLRDDCAGDALLQWYYVTANSCKPEGYNNYPFPSSAWFSNGVSTCSSISADGNGAPEQFWNCAEVYIDGNVGPTTTSPTKAPYTTPPNPPTAVTPVPTFSDPTPVQKSPTYPPSVAHRDDSRLIAYLGNWQSCPTTSQVAAYTHIVIAFAVSYTWSPGKNICSAACDISEPPICNNMPNTSLVQEWQRAGKKVILSFGGAGMGGSWSSSTDDCWEQCYGKEEHVISQLVTIVDDLGLDGIDLDFEYHMTTSAVEFLNEVTTGLWNGLPSGSEITHAPMDSDIIPNKLYYEGVLKVIGHQLDFLMPQYYNGITRPVLDGINGNGSGSMSALDHYASIVDNIFAGDPKRMVFGFCISDCGGTSSNADKDQASTVMADLATYYPCNGGAFFWVSEHDTQGSWSSAVGNTINTSAVTGCASSTSPVSPTPSPSSSPISPTASPTSSPTVSPSDSPTSSPTSLPCPSHLKKKDCRRAKCKWISVGSSKKCFEKKPSCPDYDVKSLCKRKKCKWFSIGSSNKCFKKKPLCSDYDKGKSCRKAGCSWKSKVCSIKITVAPTSTPSVPSPAPTSSSRCPTGYSGLVAIAACKGYTTCINGVDNEIVQLCGVLTLFNKSCQCCDWPNMFICDI